jgi:hypothetical protein
VDNYLDARGRTPGLQQWRFRQIDDALRLLFCQLVRPDWAGDYDWYRRRAFASELEPGHPTLQRVADPSQLVGRATTPCSGVIVNTIPMRIWHSFAMHLLQNGKDTRLAHELLGHADVGTTIIYTHVIQNGGLGVQSPRDALR